MKLGKAAIDGHPTWGIVDVDAGTITPVRGGLLDWGPGVTAGASEPEVDRAPVPLSTVTFLPPVDPSSQVVGVGMNYWSHLHKLGVTERPPSTVGYFKPQSALVGQDAEILHSHLTEQLDFEVELVIVIGAPDIAFSHPMDAVLGYTVGNDVSARDTPSPLGGYDLFTMKSLTGSTPLGPWIVTKDELGGGEQPDLEISLRVNGEGRQKDKTSNMLWSLEECMQFVLERMPLTTGDVVFTGTTDGVGMEDGRFLAPGDVVETEVSGIGVLRNVVSAVQPRPS
jgi:2-keto-4-pentenoate hydratase/2-oxohepta-3-ene-1,7-dioic acid hydratase in catechol pathway